MGCAGKDGKLGPMLTSAKAGCWAIVLMTFGIALTLIGAAVSGVILLSGPWGIGHGWPILLISIPLLVIGVFALRAYRQMKSGEKTISEIQK